MPLTRVVTTAKCSANLQVGQTLHQPSRDIELDMSEDDVAILLEQTAGALVGMFSRVGDRVLGEPARKPEPVRDLAPVAEKAPTKTAKASAPKGE